MNNSSPVLEGDRSLSSLLPIAISTSAKLRRGELFEVTHRLVSARALVLALVSPETAQEERIRPKLGQFERQNSSILIESIYETVPTNYSVEACRGALSHTLRLFETQLSATLSSGGSTAQHSIAATAISKIRLSVVSPSCGPARISGSISKFIDRCVETLSGDAAIVAIGIKGSRRDNTGLSADIADDFSDVDLIVVKGSPTAGQNELIVRKLESMIDRHALCINWRATNDISLIYAEPYLKLDLDILTPEEMLSRKEGVTMIWERDSLWSNHIVGSSSGLNPRYPGVLINHQRQMSSLAVSCNEAIARHSYLKATAILDRMRSEVLGPLAAIRCNRIPRGVRRIESWGEAYIPRLAESVVPPSMIDCRRALDACLKLYEAIA